MKKSKRLLANLHDKTQYVTGIRNSKRALSHRLVLKKLHRILKFKQKAWLKSYIDLRKKAKNDFEKDFFELMNNAVFGKTIENVRKHEDTKLVTTGKKNKLSGGRNKLSCYKVFHRHFAVYRNKNNSKIHE